MNPLPFSSSSSLALNETSFHKHKNHTQFHMPLVSTTNSYNFYFNGPGHHLTSTSPAATGQQRRRNKVKNKIKISAGAMAHDNQIQCKETDIYKHKPRNDFLWNDRIRVCVKNRSYDEALRMYYQMQRAGKEPDKSVFISVINACRSLSDLQAGRKIHKDIVAMGFESDVFVGTAVVSMYFKCGSLENARQVFGRMRQRDVVSWNAMISGYYQNGHPYEALAFFNEIQACGIKPNLITMVSVLSACVDLLALQQGKQIHSHVIRTGFEFNVVLDTGFVDMYAKCGEVNMAYKLFERMPKRDVVSWNAIITGYSKNGNPHDALAVFNEMQIQGIKPNATTISTVLHVCANLLALEPGKQIHNYAIRSRFESDVFVGSGLVNLYAKCGHIGIARQVFDKMLCRNVVSWNAMILGYGIHGHVEGALALFAQMQQTGTKPNHVTFIGVLTACSHAGLVEEGLQYFDSMKTDYGFTPELKHYACLVDLLGRAGRVDEAHGIIKKMPLEPDAAVWGALLGACRTHCNILLGQQAAKHLFELEPDNAGNYVLLSNIYAEAGRREDAAKLLTMMKKREVKKQPGWSFIEVNKEVHTFIMGDRTHPQSEKIYAILETLYGKIKDAGYVPNTSLVLQDVEEEVKENTLCSHSEKLAIAFGIINTSLGMPIRIMKNLRVCSDCHNATKFISKTVGREIIVRDANRFHHFKDGLCSCGDFW